MKISKSEARQLILAGSLAVPAHTPGDVVNRLGYVQIDSISVIERAHHHVMWSRFPGYQNDMLNGLQESPRQIFEYWAHAAAYLPIQDFRFCLPRMRRIKKNGFEWFPRDKQVMKYVLQRITSEGPLQAKDFKDMGDRPGPWWGWKPAKIALEHLFMEGTLSIVKRNGFQKVYDLTERVLPAHLDTRMPTPLQTADYLIERALRSLVVISMKDIVYLRKDHTERVPHLLDLKIKRGDIVPLTIEGVKDTYYCSKESLETLSAAPPPAVHILSPFDNLVINRRRLPDLYDFDYIFECYVPPAKRKIGYFSLPVLYNDRFVGILDAKAERKEQTFIIKHLYLDHFPDLPGEPDAFFQLFIPKLNAFKTFNGCVQTTVEKIFPQHFESFL